MLYQLLPTHLVLQPALSSCFAQPVPINDALDSLGTEGTLIRKGPGSGY